jgi:hypothetical protein
MHKLYLNIQHHSLTLKTLCTFHDHVKTRGQLALVCWSFKRAQIRTHKLTRYKSYKIHTTNKQSEHQY